MDPKFEENVYACSVYGDVARQNKMWYVDGDSAHELARRFGGVPMLSAVSDMTGVINARWHTTRIPPESPLLPPAGMRQDDPQKVQAILSLPTYLMWVLMFPGVSVPMNAGFLADYYRRNPEDKFPGLADKYVKSSNGRASSPLGKETSDKE